MKELKYQGRHIELRAAGVLVVNILPRAEGFDGVIGRNNVGSGSARLMNWRGVSGEPLFEGDDRIERGL